MLICPGCLTPLDHNEHTGHADAGSPTAAYRDDEILRQLDPDNDDKSGRQVMSEVCRNTEYQQVA